MAKDIAPHRSRRCEALKQEGCVEAGRIAGQPILGDTVTGKRIHPDEAAMTGLLLAIKRGDHG